jgi:hypothetical protein
MNALQVYGASHPDSVVTIVDMVFSGSAVVDRIALGTNKLYGWGISRAFSCGGDEANC